VVKKPPQILTDEHRENLENIFAHKNENLKSVPIPVISGKTTIK